MKIFNGRLATEDYMSTHSLTFSTPDMTLKKFALWLSDQVNDPKTNVSVPRLLLYLEDKTGSQTQSSTINTSNFLPDIDETFKPTGAIAELYKSDDEKTDNKVSTRPEKRYCINCGANIKLSSKFCNKCGSVQ